MAGRLDEYAAGGIASGRILLQRPSIGQGFSPATLPEVRAADVAGQRMPADGFVHCHIFLLWLLLSLILLLLLLLVVVVVVVVVIVVVAVVCCHNLKHDYGFSSCYHYDDGFRI